MLFKTKLSLRLSTIHFVKFNCVIEIFLLLPAITLPNVTNRWILFVLYLFGFLRPNSSFDYLHILRGNSCLLRKSVIDKDFMKQVQFILHSIEYPNFSCVFKTFSRDSAFYIPRAGQLEIYFCFLVSFFCWPFSYCLILKPNFAILLLKFSCINIFFLQFLEDWKWW